jgi:hypothetical protein
MDRERKRLEEVARSRGYESTEKMLYDLYTVQQMPLKELAKNLFTPMWTLRKRLDEVGIQMRSRGGPNNRPWMITREVVEEVSREGVVSVARRLGVNEQQFRKRLKDWYKKRGGQFED